MGKSSADTSRHPLFERPLVIVLVYFTVSAIWILLSDNVVYLMVEDPATRNQLSMVKGIAFILVTSLLLYYLVKKGFDSLKRSQASLRQSETRIRAMIERAPYGIIESDQKGTVVRANLEANQILGTAGDELLGVNLDRFVEYSPSSSHSNQGDHSLTGVQRFIRKDGRRIWVQRISAQINDGGPDGYTLEMVQDVTDQRDGMIQLARHAEELEVLYDVSRRAIESEVAADSLENICDVAVNRLRAASALVCLRSDSGKMEIVAQKGAAFSIDLERIDGGGSFGDNVRMVEQANHEYAIIPLIDEGRPIGLMVFGHAEPGWFTKERLAPFQSLANLSLLSVQKVRMVDMLRQYANNLEDKVVERTKDLTHITEELAEEVERTKEAQETLFQEKERLDVTLHSIGEGVIVTDTDGRILIANHIAEQRCEMAGPITSNRISDMLPMLDPLTEQPVKDYWVSIGPDGISEAKGVVINLSGRRDLSYNSAAVRDRTGTVIGYVIVFRDITEDVRMQKAVAEAQRLDSIGQLAGGIAHSFNNILTSILGNIEMLSYAQLDAARKQACLDDARQSAIKAKDLSNQLLTFAKGGEPIRKDISVLDILKRLAEQLSDGSKINIMASSMTDRYMVNADEIQIGQAFSNLLTNALSSAPEGVIIGVSLSYQDIENARSRTASSTRYVVVRLEAPNWISQRPGDEQAQASAWDEKQGLDLAIANSIVRRHDGFMVMDSSAKGSNYKVYLLAWSESVNVPTICAKERVDRPAKVLVMDDDEGVLEVLKGMISIMGHQVVAAKEGGEAIDLYAQADASGEPFDVVIMDLNIPGGLGGRETIRRLQERYDKVNAIVSSGYSNDPITANYISYGFKGALPKPYTMKQLEDAIQKAMAEQ